VLAAAAWAVPKSAAADSAIAPAVIATRRVPRGVLLIAAEAMEQIRKKI
jgi:hypothetical protein